MIVISGEFSVQVILLLFPDPYRGTCFPRLCIQIPLHARNLQADHLKRKQVYYHEEEYDFYTPEEIALLDKFHEFSNHKFIDEEIYDIMQKFNNDEELIKNELKERLKDFLKGDEFDWVEIGESE